MQITSYSFITILYADEMLRLVALSELCIGVGLGLGPVLGSFLSSYLSYKHTMYGFGTLCALTGYLSFVLLPKALNSNPEDEAPKSSSSLTTETRKPLTWCSFFANKDILFMCVAALVATFNVVFFYGWITSDLSHYEWKEEYTGYTIGLEMVIYIVVCVFFTKLFSNVPNRFLFTAGFFGLTFVMLLLGPSSML